MKKKEKQQQKPKILNMSVLTDKGDINDLMEYMDNIPEVFKVEYDKENNILTMEIGIEQYIVRGGTIANVMNYIQGFIDGCGR